MAWQDTLLDASFRGLKFDCLRTQDSATRDTAEHEYPYVDGADVEDLGRKARQLCLSAIFWGKDYEKRLQAFMVALDEAGAGELIHPVFGSIEHAQLVSYEIGHDADNPDACTLELNFIEATPGNSFFARDLPEQQAAVISQLADTARSGGISAFADALSAIKGVGAGLSRLNGLRDMLTGTLSAIRAQVKGIIGGVLGLIDTPRAFAGELMGLLNGMVDLRGFDVGVISADWKNLFSQAKGVVRLPATLSSNAGQGGAKPSSPVSAGVSNGDDKNSPNNQATPAYVDDVKQVAALLQLVVATVLAETAGQIFADEAREPTLSPAEIERITQDVREELQTAIDTQRELHPLVVSRPITEALKSTALAVQVAALAVIAQRPPLVRRTLEAPGNLHLIAFKWYGDYTRAAELLRLNPHIRHPNALQAGDSLYAYAR